jgi:tetratricopeptide (TPR) repeat protein
MIVTTDMTPHYDEDSLLEYVDGSPAMRDEIDSHVAACAGCARTVTEHRQLLALVSDDSGWQWNDDNTDNARVAVTASEIARLGGVLSEERAAASALLDDVLTSPPSWWRLKLINQAEGSTAGVVYELVDRAAQLVRIRPEKALEATTLAIDIATQLAVQSYPGDLTVVARAHAHREHGFVLAFVGRFPEAIVAIDCAERLFRQTSLPEYELARVDLIRAMIYAGTDRKDDAVLLARRAAQTFLQFGELRRYLNARITEGAFLYRAGAMQAAHDVWRSLEAEHEAELEPTSLTMVQNNIGLCLRDLQRYAEASDYFMRALAGYEALGCETEKVRTRWSIATMYVNMEKLEESVPIFRTTAQEFHERGMESDAALASLELVEVLLVLGRTEQVPAICRDLLDRFVAAGMTSSATTALAFLREAVALGNPPPELVRHVHDHLRKLAAQPQRPSISPVD